jgi:hypothetical protein
LKTSRAVVAAVVLVVSLVTYVPVSFGGGPVFWEIESRADVEKGDANGVSIADNGRITLAPKLDMIYDTKEAYVWSSIADSLGNVYLGTGHEGRIFKVDSSGKGTMILDTSELDVTALAVDRQNNIYAGTSPNGKIYKITPDGKSNVFFEPKEKYIWSLAFDKSSILYAGTGEKGKIFKIAADGKGAILTDTDETHIMSLTLDSQGNLIAGTDPSGMVLRIDPTGKTFALFDSPMREIHSLLAAADGGVYALGISAKAAGDRLGAGSSTSGITNATSGGEGVTITVDEDTTSTPSLQTSSSSNSTQSNSMKTAVYKLGKDGQSDLYWSSNTDVGFDLEMSPDNRVLVATGTKGRIFAIDQPRHSTLLIQSTEDQTSTIIKRGNDLFATSSNLGKLFRLGSEANSTGTYQSVVRDAAVVSQWGNLSWRGTGVQIQTRTGNTETPDATWSDWSTAYTNSAGSGVASPSARFVQWKATLKSEGRNSAKLDSVMLAYLPRNIAPTVNSITVLAPSVGLQEIPQQAIDPGIVAAGLNPTQFGFATNVPPRKIYQKGARSLTWVGEDLNGDNLLYSVYYHNIEDTEWHPLKEDIKENYLTLDVDALPDGTYLFKVVISDGPSNPSGRALSGDRVRDPVDIDNTPPQIKSGTPATRGREVTVKFDAIDALSVIKHAEYSLDGGNWTLAFPDDGIADSRSESYTLKLTVSGAGEHTIAFRAADSNVNVGSAKVTVRVP